MPRTLVRKLRIVASLLCLRQTRRVYIFKWLDTEARRTSSNTIERSEESEGCDRPRPTQLSARVILIASSSRSSASRSSRTVVADESGDLNRPNLFCFGNAVLP